MGTKRLSSGPINEQSLLPSVTLRGRHGWLMIPATDARRPRRSPWTGHAWTSVCTTKPLWVERRRRTDAGFVWASSTSQANAHWRQSYAATGSCPMQTDSTQAPSDLLVQQALQPAKQPTLWKSASSLKTRKVTWAGTIDIGTCTSVPTEGALDHTPMQSVQAKKWIQESGLTLQYTLPTQPHRGPLSSQICGES